MRGGWTKGNASWVFMEKVHSYKWFSYKGNVFEKKNRTSNYVVSIFSACVLLDHVGVPPLYAVSLPCVFTAPADTKLFLSCSLPPSRIYGQEWFLHSLPRIFSCSDTCWSFSIRMRCSLNCLVWAWDWVAWYSLISALGASDPIPADLLPLDPEGLIFYFWFVASLLFSFYALYCTSFPFFFHSGLCTHSCLLILFSVKDADGKELQRARLAKPDVGL